MGPMLMRAGWILLIQGYTFDGLQEGVNYSFTVNQTGFSGGGVLSFGTVYPRTFTAGKQHCDRCTTKSI